MNWTHEEETKLETGVASGWAWANIAAQLPGRTVQACQSKACYLRQQGKRLGNPERVKPQGEAGRPKNKQPSDRLSFRLDRAMLEAFRQLGTDLGKRPGALLRVGLEQLVQRTPAKVSVPQTARVVETGERVAVEWGVPSKLLRAAVKASKRQATETAELAVRELLTSYGYRIESKS